MAVLDATGLGRWRRWLVRGAAGKTLEVGCGTGRNLPLYEASTRVVALEPSWSALMRAGARAPGVPLVCGTAEALPFKADTFETVVSGLVFCSVAKPATGLGEIKRVLRLMGTLRMVEHVRSEHRPGARWQDFIQRAWTRIMAFFFPNRPT